MTHRLVIGLGFGDESKGATVDWLCSQEEVKAVIRFNGGPQAAHNVVTPDGRHHTFAQFGSGTFLGVPTHLSRFMMFNPFNIWPERTHLVDECGLPDPLQLLTVSWDALLVTPYHVEKNRQRENKRGDKRHGSTGQGIGETRYLLRRYPHMATRVSDLKAPFQLRHKLTQIRDLFVAEGYDTSYIMTPDDLVDVYLDMQQHINIVPDDYTQTLLDSGPCVFEGAQGVLLDELYGFNPHTTFSKTTQRNARELLDGRDAECWGLSRVYHTRHGAGPFPTEGTVSFEDFPEHHNVAGNFNGSWRVGGLDLSLLRYAITVNDGIDKLSVSHMDYLTGDVSVPVYDGYDMENVHPRWLPKGHVMGAPYNREQSHIMGPEMFKVTPLSHDEMQTVEDVRRVFKDGVGYEPDLFSYGPTREDRHLGANLLAVP